MGGGGSSAWRRRTASGGPPPNGVRPASSSYRTIPAEYRSAAKVAVPCWAVSGAMYSGVPIKPVVLVSAVPYVSRAIPKSVSLTCIRLP